MFNWERRIIYVNCRHTLPIYHHNTAWHTVIAIKKLINLFFCLLIIKNLNDFDSIIWQHYYFLAILSKRSFFLNIQTIFHMFIQSICYCITPWYLCILYTFYVYIVQKYAPSFIYIFFLCLQQVFRICSWNILDCFVNLIYWNTFLNRMFLRQEYCVYISDLNQTPVLPIFRKENFDSLSIVIIKLVAKQRIFEVLNFVFLFLSRQ